LPFITGCGSAKAPVAFPASARSMHGCEWSVRKYRLPTASHAENEMIPAELETAKLVNLRQALLRKQIR
jgi:hypothetical protein